MMLKSLILNLILLPLITSQGIKWVWQSGDQIGNVSVSSNSPGSRSGSGSWFDNKKRLLYLFGGRTYTKESKPYLLSNDIWTLHMSTLSKWSLVEPKTENTRKPSPRYSPSICGVPDAAMFIYGGITESGKILDDTWMFSFVDNTWRQLDKPNVTEFDHPSDRWDQSSWCLYNKLIVFGGRNSKNEFLHDMWSFSMIDLRWTEMESSKKYPKNNDIGQRILSYPKPRSSSTTISGMGSPVIYLFGGNTMDIGTNKDSRHIYNINDLWKYDCSKDSWSRIAGDDSSCLLGSYGHIQAGDKNNWPGCRTKASGWIDSHGNLWMFGGKGADSEASDRLLNDLWQYDFLFKMWTWMGGSKYGNTAGEYSKSKSKNHLGSRSDVTCWNEYGNFQYIYGGIGHDANGKKGLLADLWTIDVHSKVDYGKYPSFGSIFMIVFGLCGLILLITALSLYNRSLYKFSEHNKKKMGNSQYSMLQNEDED